MFPPQDALLEAARSTVKAADRRHRGSLGYLGMDTFRARRETVNEMIRSFHEHGRKLERRARHQALTARPEECVEIGVMTAVAPFELADFVSLAEPRIRRARRPASPQPEA